MLKVSYLVLFMSVCFGDLIQASNQENALNYFNLELGIHSNRMKELYKKAKSCGYGCLYNCDCDLSEIEKLRCSISKTVENLSVALNKPEIRDGFYAEVGRRTLYGILTTSLLCDQRSECAEVFEIAHEISCDLKKNK